MLTFDPGAPAAAPRTPGTGTTTKDAVSLVTRILLSPLAGRATIGPGDPGAARRTPLTRLVLRLTHPRLLAKVATVGARAATVEAKAAMEEARAVTEEDKVATEEDKVVTEEDKVVTEEDKVVTEEDKVVMEEDKVVMVAVATSTSVATPSAPTRCVPPASRPARLTALNPWAARLTMIVSILSRT
ncbi:hypothetical protein FRC10_007181 [Ceratobasidium sp. 414]|nr:hypothetical protein FRC10_007181 [Ceratobasidium sp. 414]